MPVSQVNLRNRPVTVCTREQPLGAALKKHMEDHPVIFSILRMSVRLPIANVHVYLDRAPEDPNAVQFHRRVRKIGSRGAIPDAKLHDTYPLAGSPLELPPELARKPPGLHLQFARPAPLTNHSPHTLASSLVQTSGACKIQSPHQSVGGKWYKICCLRSMPLRLPKILLALTALLFVSFTLRLHAEVREIATIFTSAGTMEFELFRDVSPRTVKNFKYLADTHFYDSTAFHRAVPGFMIQGGDPNTRYADLAAQYGSGGPGYTIPDEPVNTGDHPNRAHTRGVLSMAKTAFADSGGSGFFIMYGNAPHLDGVHAPIGSLISGGSVLAILESQPVAGETPVNRLAVNSVRIRSEEITDTPRVAYAALFPSGMAHGLLRNFDRNIFGSYQLSFTKTGTLSGQLEYFGRRSSFTGKLTPVAGSTSESECSVLIDSKAAFPLRVRIRLRRVAATGASVSITLCGLNTDNADLSKATDLNDSTLVSGATELAIPNLGSRYTAVLKPNGLSNIRGSAFLALNFLKTSGVCIASGKLPDGRALAFSKVPTNEGGRYMLPVFICELTKANEALRSIFPSVPLANWQGVYRNLWLTGGLEMRPSGDPADISPPAAPTREATQTDAQYTSTPAFVAYQTAYAAYSNWLTNLSYLYWYRQAIPANSVPSEQNGLLISTMAPWTPPATGIVLAPFRTNAGAGRILGENLASTAFQVSRTNTTTTFGANPSGVILRFNPLDGTFQGSYAADGGRLSFYGVNVTGSGYTKSSGFAIKAGASIPVSLTAP